MSLSQGANVEYKIEPTGVGLYRIKYDGKGSMPVALRGLYTSKHEIEKAVDAYLIKNEGKTNAKNKSNG